MKRIQKHSIKTSLAIILLLIFPLHAENDSLVLFEHIIKTDSVSLDKKLETIEKCISLSEKKGNELKKIQFLMEKGEVFFQQEMYIECVRHMISLDSLIEQKLYHKEISNKKSLEKLHIESLNILGFGLIYSPGKEGEAIRVFNKIMTLYGQDPISAAAAKALNGMGVVMVMKDYDSSAENYFRKSLDIYKKLNDVNGVYKISSNLGNILINKKEYQEALSFLLEAHKIVIDQNYKGQELLYSTLNMGIVYNGLKKHSLADRYFEEAIDLSKRKGSEHLLSLSRINYSNNLLEQGKYKEAGEQATTLLSGIKDGFLDTKIDAYQILYKVNKATQNYQRASEIQEKIILLKDSLFKVSTDEKLLALRAEFDEYKIRQEERIKKQEYDIQEFKILKRNWIIILLTLVSFAFLLGCFFLFRRMRKQRMINQMLESEYREIKISSQEKLQKREMELGGEIEVKTKELIGNTLMMDKFKDMSTTLLQKVRYLKSMFVLKNKERKILEEMESLLKEFSMNKEWGEFQMYFEQVDRSFFDKLNTLYPNLTPNEKRLCALIHLNLNSKEIASLTNRTFQSIGTAKFRLKKKMKLEPETNLYELFSQL